jgi:hypothetical protein
VSADPAATWAAILDRFEADIALAVSGGAAQAWSPPADPGPLPGVLRSRAVRLLDAQRESIGILARTSADASAHLDAIDAVPDSRNSGQALYLDVRG